MTGQDLEALSPEGAPDGDVAAATVPRRRLRRWPFLVASGLVVCLFAGAWIHRVLTTSELTFLSGQWDGAQSVVDHDGATAIAQLRLSSGTTAYTTSLLSAAYREQATALAQVRRRLHDRLLVDPALAHLRQTMVSALSSEEGDLGRDADFWTHFPADPSGSNATTSLTSVSFAARRKVEVTLTRALRRSHLTRPAPARVPPTLAAPPGQGLLGHFADEATNTSLLVATPGALELVDIDRNLITRLPSAFDPRLEVVQIVDPGDAHVAVRAAAPDGEGELIGLSSAAPGVGIGVVPIALDQALVAGDGPGRLLARRPDGSVIELDEQLRQVARPLAVPDVDQVIGLAQAGVVVVTPPLPLAGLPSGPGTIEVLDRAHSSTVRRVVGKGEAFALCRNNLVWSTSAYPPGGLRLGQTVVHLMDLGSGKDRVLSPGPPGLSAVGAPWSCSPDGTRVAGAWWGPMAGTPTSSVTPGVIDLASGVIQLTSDGFGNQPDASSITWTPTGDRIFLAGNPGPNRGPDLVTFRPGDRQVTHLRLPGLVLAFCPVAVSPG